MEKILLKHKDKIFYFILSIVKNYWEAEDIMQDVMIKALKNIDKVRETNKLENWMYRIAKNTTFNHLKRKKILSFIGVDKIYDEYLEDDALTPDQQYEKESLENNVKKLLDQLKHTYRTVVYLKIYEQKTFIEIAKIMDKSESTVKTFYYKSLKMLKGKMERNDEKRY